MVIASTLFALLALYSVPADILKLVLPTMIVYAIGKSMIEAWREGKKSGDSAK